MRRRLAGFALLLFVMLVAIAVPVIASCASDGSVNETRREITLDEAIAEIEEYPVPSGVEEGVFEELREELTRKFDEMAVRRIVSAAPSGEENRVDDLTLIDNGDSTYNLTWSYKNLGDYDLNGEVGVSDITPIALNYLAKTDDDVGDDAYETWIDRSGDGEVGISDITPIAEYYLNDVVGYRVVTSDSATGGFMPIGNVVPFGEAGVFPKVLLVPLVTGALAYVSVQPVDAAGGVGQMSVVVAIPQPDEPPLPPENLQTSDGAYSDRIELTWTKSTGATGYKIYRDAQDTPIIELGDVDTWDDTTVGDTDQHAYWLKATNDAGDSEFSESDTGFMAAGGTILFEEQFEDTDFSSRGWYDSPGFGLTTDEHAPGSTRAVEFHFEQGATGPTVRGGRVLFEETNSVYLSFYIKYSANWTGSDRPYHPHEFHFVTTENGVWVGPAYTHLTTYIEHNEGRPLLAIQDAENIDESRIGEDLTDVTEDRAVAGCNGSSDGYPDDCYLSGDTHRNGKRWMADGVYFADSSGPYYKNDWHFIEAYFQLNSIVEGKGICDGVVRYWYDGEMLIDHDDVLLRTGQHPDMMFNQFMVFPYIGDGSPIDQTMWLDNLTIATGRP